MYVAASRAIGQLSDMDLVKYEALGVDSTPDLSLWEEMAPVIRDTVVDVNALLNVIRELFVQDAPSGSGVEARVARVLREGMIQLAEGVTQLGETMRVPAVVSDRWVLLAEIQRLRGRYRELVGHLVYESASLLADVTRPEVVPGYDAEVKSSVMVRSVVADLQRLIAARLAKVREAEPEDVQWHAQQLQRELDTFGRTGAYRGLRAQDKRRILEVRMDVSYLALQDNPSKDELLGVVEELDAFVRSLHMVNQRQLLIDHDRVVWAGCGVRLERAMELVGSEDALAAKVLSDAVTEAQALYGREPELDAFLRKARKMLVSALRGEELRTTLETFHGLLGRLNVT